MIYHANVIHKNVGMAILIADKINFTAKNITKDKENHFID